MAGPDELSSSPSLIKTFESIIAPTSPVVGPLVLAARPIAGSTVLRVAKDTQGAPAVLVATTGSGTHRPPLKLRHLSVLFDTQCQIETLGGGTEHGRFTVIRCLEGTPDLNRYFLVVAAAALQAQDDALTPTVVSEVVDHLTELFRLLAERPSTSVRGLWAELLIMSKSNDPEKLLRSWHVTNEDLHDFNDGESRLEVKGSARHRVHRFSAEQLTAVDSPLYVASVLVEHAPVGVGIASLRDEICKRIGWNAELVQKLDRVITGALGDGAPSAGDVLFDVTRAWESIQFYEGGSIPRLEPPFPDGVGNVTFDVDLEIVEPLAGAEMTAMPLLVAAAQPQ